MLKPVERRTFLVSDFFNESRLHEAPRTRSMKTRSLRDHRDIAVQTSSVSHQQATVRELSPHGIDVDDRIVIAHESLSLDTGSYSARWRRVRNVYLGELVDSKIGDLPDRSVVLPRRGKFMTPGPKEAVEKALASTYRTSFFLNLVINVIQSLIPRHQASFLLYPVIDVIRWLIEVLVRSGEERRR